MKNILKLSSVLLLGVAFVGIFPRVTRAATYTWDGGGLTEYWSECSNWSSDLCPGQNDSVIFNGTSVKNATLDIPVNIQSVNMNIGYTGTLTQANQLTLSRNFDHDTEDGTFQWSSGTLAFIGSSAAVFNVDTGDDVFGNLELNKTNRIPVAITRNDEVVVMEDVTLTNGYIQTTSEGEIYGATLNVQGNVTQAAGFDGVDTDETSFIHFIHVDFGNDAQSQTYTILGGVGPWLRLDSAADANDRIIFSAQGALTGLETTSSFAGQVPLENPNDVPVGIWHWNQMAGDYDASAQSSWSFAEFHLGASASFISPSLVTAAYGGNYDWDVDGTQTFNDFTVNKTHYGSIHIGLGADTFVVLGDLNLVDGGVWDGVLDVRGNVTQGPDYEGGAGVVSFGDDAVVQTYTVNGGGAQTLRFDAPADASDSLVFAAVGAAAVEVTSGFSGVIPVSNPLDITPDFWLWSQAAGTYDASTQSNWNIDALSITGGTFIAPQIVTAWRGASPWDVNVSQTFNDLTVSRDGLFRAVLLSPNDTLIVNGDLRLLDGRLDYGSLPATGSVRVRGDVMVGPLWDGGNVTLRFIGARQQSFDLTGAEGLFDGDIVISKNGGQVTLLSDLIMDYATNGYQDLTINAGGALDVGASGNHSISLIGNWTNFGSFIAQSGTVNMIGRTQRILGTTTFYNLTKQVSAPGTLVLAANRTQTVLGELRLTGQAAGLLTLRSTVNGTQALLDARGIRTLEYLQVRDLNNSSPTVMTCGMGCVDLGNNTGWVF